MDFGLLSGGLLLATVLRKRFGFFQRYLIPNALTAGFILLPVYNYVAPLVGVDTSGLENLVYHLLSISFVAIALRKSAPREKTRDSRILATSVSVLSQYAIQALLGLLVTLLLINTIFPELFHSFGLLMPLGFALGPGQALAIGQGWTVFGIEDAGSVGLTFAAVGYLVACFGGVAIINVGIRRGWMSRAAQERMKQAEFKTGIRPEGSELPAAGRLTTESEAIDSMSLHAGLVLLVYFLTYLLLNLLQWALAFAGPTGTELATNLWGISFIFAVITALAVKAILNALKVDYVLDSPTLTRISGFSVDMMVTAAVASISLIIVGRFWLPILIIAATGTLGAILVIPWFCSRIFRDHRFARMLVIFGVSTGTLSSGLALLRIVDPEFDTPVATDYAYAASLTFVLAIPFILSINLSARTFATGDMRFFWLGVLVAAGYLLFVIVGFLFISRRRALMAPGAVWYRTGRE